MFCMQIKNFTLLSLNMDLIEILFIYFPIDSPSQTSFYSFLIKILKNSVVLQFRDYDSLFLNY